MVEFRHGENVNVLKDKLSETGAEEILIVPRMKVYVAKKAYCKESTQVNAEQEGLGCAQWTREGSMLPSMLARYTEASMVFLVVP